MQTVNHFRAYALTAICALMLTSLVGCAKLANNFGAPANIVTGVATAEDILCVANSVGLPFETQYPQSWIPEIVATYCAIKSGYEVQALITSDQEIRRVAACVNTLPERDRLTKEHQAYIDAWDEVCGDVG